MSLPYCFVLNHVSDNKAGNKQYNLSTLSVVRSLGRRKVPVILVTPSKADAVISSKFIKKVEYSPDIHNSEEEMLNFLLQIPKRYTGKLVLFPTTDECSNFVGNYYDVLSDVFLIPSPNASTISKINNKKYQYESAEALNIPIPETYFPKNPEDVAELALSISNYPYVIKPNISFEWKKKSSNNEVKGKKGIKVSNPDELITASNDVYVAGHEYMIQEVIGGRDERLVTFLGFMDSNSEPDSYFIRRKIRQNPLDFGYCTMTESCHNPIVLDQSIKILQYMKYHGVAGVEWKLDPKTDTYKLIEINARPVNTTGCAIASGVDLPAIAYFNFIEKPLPSVREWEDGQLWAWIAMDFWAAKELASENKITMWSWFRKICTIKADAIFSFDDLSLSMSYYYMFFKNMLVNKINKFFK